jgi:enediyne biosynthesis protein E4
MSSWKMVKNFMKKIISIVLTLTILLLIYILSNLDSYFKDNKNLSSNFDFIKQTVPSLNFPKKNIREVHPSFKRISGWISAVGASVSVGDLDGDGIDNDLCFVDPRTDKVFIYSFNNNYEPIILDIPDNRKSIAPTGCLFGDFNEDGLLDVLVYYWGRTPVIFYQNISNKLSAKIFKPVPLCEKDDRWFTDCATTADFDGDGHIDILICNYFPDGADVLNADGSGVQYMHDSKSHSYSGGKKHFFLWNFSKTDYAQFKHCENVLEPKTNHGWTLAVGACDLNNDMLPEIYLSQDFGPDKLLLNRSTPGNLSFELLKGKKDWTKPKSFILGNDSFKGMGIDFCDVNNDQYFDMFVTNITSEWALQESNMLWIHNKKNKDIDNGIAPFTQQSERYGVSRTGWSWDAKFGDFNNDSIYEIVVTTGFLKGDRPGWARLQSLGTANDKMLRDPNNWPTFVYGDDLSGHETNGFFARNSIEEKFKNIATQIGLNDVSVSRGIGLADFNNDGLLDLAFANQWEDSLIYINNSKNQNLYLSLSLRLKNKSSNIKVINDLPTKNIIENTIPAIGAKITLFNHIFNEKFVSFVDGGNGHAATRSHKIHFGLGKLYPELITDLNFEVEILWRSRDGVLHKQRSFVKPGNNTIILGE